MKASQNQQADLLLLGNLDFEIARAKNSLAELASGKSTKDMRELNLKLAGELIEARNQLDSVELELSRAEADLTTVEQRIEKDNVRLNATSNSKDAQGIQSELLTLAKRKSELEDMELAILDKKDEVAALFAEVQARKTLNESELRQAETKIEAEVLKQRSGLDLMVQQRAQQAAQLPVELLELYEKKATRGLAIGRLIGRECGACRISLGATAFAEIQGLASEEIATCPDCQAILVR